MYLTTDHKHPTRISKIVSLRLDVKSEEALLMQECLDTRVSLVRSGHLGCRTSFLLNLLSFYGAIISIRWKLIRITCEFYLQRSARLCSAIPFVPPACSLILWQKKFCIINRCVGVIYTSTYFLHYFLPPIDMGMPSSWHPDHLITSF